ncbi:DUF3419 family protein [Oscillatoria sp. FACHB-1407]|uniref:DUF3419 family protein n=1 Tax=Oscillatoria sp. FACHB-1407 TaxID=2692847 RepID=UPI0016873BE7|nr:DUF3419 family protein [Oscillatoria sp. FACHB-1407]MBD2461089.1 DUF3419 family protein [Oscillatoria sp. FACHB-1407]
MTYPASDPISEIAFSQVREDPRVELSLVDYLAERQNHPLRVLLVASGGCTALSLLVSPAIAQVEAVDLNPAQLHLVELRRHALVHLSLEDQLQLIGADCLSDPPTLHQGELPFAPTHRRQELYDKLRPWLPEATRVFWDVRPEQIAFGVNRVGRFEALFRELAQAFAAEGLDPLNQPAIALTSPRWKPLFEKVFERNKLARIFGEAAVNYSMDRSFGEHFADVFAQALRSKNPAQNYFVTQVWGDRYTTGKQGLPLYLQAPAQLMIRHLGVERLRLHQGALADVMTQLAQTAPFDLIQLSNISDWMPVAELHKLLAIATGCLNSGGALLGRRLNGDHHLANVMAEHVRVNAELSQQLQQAERSYFYREVVVGFAQ